MKKLINFVLISFSMVTIAYQTELSQEYPFKKVILWGHKLHSHSHSYIHWAFYRAFQHLGYETLWLDDNDAVNSIDFDYSLFITEGQVDGKIPLNPTCRYVLHNCDQKKYKNSIPEEQFIALQVFTNKIHSLNVIKLDDYVYYDLCNKCLYMPWATDLLPYEIEQNKTKIRDKKREPFAVYVGFVGGGEFGNIDLISSFITACKKLNIRFQNYKNLSMDKNIETIQNALFAPAIQGQWQCNVGYIPCRIFKNISYGNWGITNSITVYNLFKQKIIFNTDTYQLAYDAKKYIESHSIEDLFELMDFVKEKHTYINRIQHLLYFLNLLKPNQNNN